MTQIHWLSQANGLFTTAADWSGGKVPKSGDDALIDAAGAVNYTVTSAGSVTVNSLALGATATLAISGKLFDLLNGTGAGANAGTILIGDGARLQVSGTVDNAGLISLSGATKATSFFVGAGGASLTGGGSLVLGGPTSSVLAINAATVLTNVDNTISGAGQLGTGKLTFVNEAAGVVDANAAGALLVNTAGSTLTNAGLMESVGAGGLTIRNTTVDDSAGGTIAAAGGQVRLQSAHVIGGVLTSSGAGAIHATSGPDILDGAAGSLTNLGRVIVDNGQKLTLAGDIANSGTIVVNAGTTATTLSVAVGGATLTGGGKINLSNSALNTIAGPSSAATLTNVDNTISGAGTIGLSGLALVNQSKGVINASAPTAMVLQSKGGVANAGLIEGTGTGGLVISATTISGAGVIKAGAGSSVSLVAARISGGTLSTGGTGVISAGGYASLIDGTSTHPVSILGAVKVGASSALTVQGALALSQTVGTTTTKGTISLTGGASQAHLNVGAPGATFTGAGSVVLGDSANNLIAGTLTGSTVSKLTNFATITGAGWIGSSLSLVNAGVIAAAGANALILETGSYKAAGSNRITNSGVLEALNPTKLVATGGLDLTDVTVSGAGTIAASGKATHVDLYNATISGQTLITTGGGVINATGFGDLIDGKTAAVTNMGTLAVAGGRLNIQGTIGGTGVITVGDSAGDFSALAVMTAGATLTGGGALVLSDGTLNSVYAFYGSGTLTNAGDTISGAGQFGSNLGLVNQAGGVINANGTHVLSLEDSSVTNAGLIEDTGAGGLQIDGSVANSGTILSAGAGGVALYGAIANKGLLEAQSGLLRLDDSVTNSATATVKVDAGGQAHLLGGAITGGALSIAAGGTLAVSYSSALTPVTLSNQGEIDVLSGGRLLLKGSLNNSGAIDVGVGGANGRIAIAGPGVTLGGGGAVVLADSNQSYIYNYNGLHATLTNLDNTISGAGMLSGYYLTLVNKAAGVIDANGANFLYIGTGGATITNAGLIESTGAGGLGLYSAVSNSGTVLAGAGSLTFRKTVANSGLLEASGGTLVLNVDTVTNTAAGSVGAVTGTVELDSAVVKGGGLFTGVGGTIAVASYAAVATASVTNQGTIAVATGARLELAGSVNNSGLIAIGAAGGYGSLGLLSGVTLSGGGTLALADSAQTLLYGPGGGVTLTNLGDTISGGGTIAQSVRLNNKAAGVVDANGKNLLRIGGIGATFTNAGLVEATGAGGLYVVGGIANSGTLAANGGAVTLYNGTVANTGSAVVSVAASSDLELYVASVTGGTVSVAAGGTIKVDVGATDTLAANSLINQGTIAVATGAQLLMQGAVNNGGAIDIGASGGAGRLGVLAGGLRLSGGGTVVLSDNASSYIYAKAGGASLTNVADTITGAGHIQGGLGLTNQAAGVIDATGANALYLGTPSDIVNAGLIENTGAGGLTIYSTVVTNSGAIAAKSGTLTVNGALVTQTGTGAVSAAAGAELLLEASTVLGGAVSIAAGGEMAVSGHVLVRAKSFTNAGTVAVANNGSLELQGTIANSGEIDIGPPGGYAHLGVDAPGVTLSGGGTVVLADNDLTHLYANGAGATLTNLDNTISGAGYIGNGNALTLVNDAAGVIEADGSHVLTLSTGGNLITNAGLIEDLGAGNLVVRSSLSNSGTVLSNGSAGVVFYGAVANSRTLEAKSGYLDFVSLTLTNTGAGLLKADAGAAVDVVNFSEVLGGTVDTEVGGKLAIYGSDYVEAAIFTNKGTVQVAAYSTLATQGKVSNTGAIDIGVAGGPGHIGVQGAGLTLVGAGQVVLSDNKYNSIRGGVPATLTNINNTITGAGYIGGSNLAIDNQAGGVIDANGTKLLQLAGAFSTFTNEGLLETTGAGSLYAWARLVNSGRVLANSSGTLTVSNVGGNSGVMEVAKGDLALLNNINNTATGVIKADKGGTIVATQLLVTGGTISIAAGGYLDNTFGNTLRLTPATFTNKGTIDVAAGKLLTSGQVANSGLIELGDGGSLGVLVAGATLSGGGTLDIGDSASSLVYAYNGLTTLTNADTIRGGGVIGGQLYVVNQAAGVIDGDGTHALVFGPNMPLITNAGLIESTSSGGVTLAQDEVVGGGTIAANGAASHVDVSFTTIIGQTLATSGGGVINITGASDLFDGAIATVTNNGSVSVGSGATLQIEGAIAGNGVIALASGVNYSDLFIDAPGATLSGGGTVSLGGGGQDYIFSYGGAATLINAGDTIVGAGLIGDSDLTLTNQAAGVIDATGFVGVNSRTLSNAGLMEATGSGRLDVRYSLVNSGTVLASGALAEVDLYGGVGNSGVLTTASAGSLRVQGTVTNTATATVNIGAGSGLILSNASVLGGAVSVKAGGQIVAVSQDTLEAATLTNAGTVLVFNSGTLTLDGDVINSGAIKVGSGSGFARIRLDGAGVTLSGGGSVTLTDNVNSYIQGPGGQTLVNVDNVISGSGRIQGTGLAITNQAAGVINASGYYALYVGGLSSDLTNAGLMEATASGGLFVFGTVSNSGTLAADGGKLSLNTISNTAAGVVIADAASTVTIDGAVTGGVLATAAGGHLATVGNVTLEVATLNNLGTIDVGDPGVLVTAGYVNNAGVINLGPAGGVGRMKIDSAGLTLGGGGVVNLADSGYYSSYIYTNAVLATLTNVSDTIQGAGYISSVDLTVINQANGVIDGDSADVLRLATGANTITNAGLIEATAGAGLTLYSAVANSGTLAGDGAVLGIYRTTIFNGGGVVTAASGYGVSLNSSQIIGGTVATAAGAALIVRGGSAIEPATLNNQGTIQLANNAYLYLDRMVNNSGFIGVGGSGGYAILDIDTDGLTLTGGGAVVLSDNAASRIVAPGGGALVNVDNTLSGGGTIGGNGSTITNQASGVIDATGTQVLFLASSGQTIVNAGLLEATNSGGAGLTVNAALDNTGTIAAAGGNVLVIGDVSGAGVAVISAGTLHTESAFSQNVTFTGTAGELDLDHGLLFSGTISGFSHTGGTSLDLGDVGFVSPNEATFSGTTAGGVLTVSDGTNVAHINLTGDYTGATFVASSDGAGGVMIVDPTATQLTTAMASFGAAASPAGQASATAPRPPPPILAVAASPHG